MLYVTHDQVEAMSMADQVVLLNAGRVEQIGPPDALYAAPDTVFAARFIGTPPMSLLQMAPAPGGGLAIAGTEAPILAGHEDPDVLLGLRPEEIQVSGQGAPAIVEVVDYVGPDTILKCRLGSEAVQVRVPRLVRVGAGETVGLRWDDASIHAFDRATGRRLTRYTTITGGPS